MLKTLAVCPPLFVTCTLKDLVFPILMVSKLMDCGLRLMEGGLIVVEQFPLMLITIGSVS